MAPEISWRYMWLAVLFISLLQQNKLCSAKEELPVGVKENDIEYNLRTFFSTPRNHEKGADNVRQWNIVRGLIRNIFHSLHKDDKITFESEDFPTGLTDYLGNSVTGRNFYLTFRGQNYGTNADQIICLCAHYESKGDVPGTDNNGSGISTLLEIAKALGRLAGKLKHTVLLVANDLEERGSWGIKHFINNYLVPVVLKNGNGPGFQGALLFETMMNFNDTPNSQKIPTISANMSQEETETLFGLLMPQLKDFYVRNDRRGDWVISMSRNKTDASLRRKIHEHWYGDADISIDDAIRNHKYKSAPLYVPGLEGQIKGPVPDVQRAFLMADYKEFYYYNGTASEMMKAVMLSDTGWYRGYMVHCYAKPCDDASQITADRMTFLATIGNTTIRTLLSMAEYDAQGNTPTTPTTSAASTVMVTMFTIVFSSALAADFF